MDEDTKMLRNCEICKDEKIDKIELDYLAENITGKEACRILNCSLYVFKNHIERHLKRDIAGALARNAPVLAKQVFDKTNEIIESCDRTLQMIKEVQKEWSDKKKPEWITAAVKLEQHLTTNVERLVKIQGEFKESSNLKVENLNIQVNNMGQELIEGMCPNCKENLAPKILKTLEKI
jgi:hypothetical protein